MTRGSRNLHDLARNLPDFASPDRCPASLLHFAAGSSKVHTSHTITRLLGI